MSSNLIKLQVGGRFKADQLRKLSCLLKRGILTRAEFERQKGEVLGRLDNEDDRTDALLMEALAMLAEPQAIPNPSAANVLCFEKRK